MAGPLLLASLTAGGTWLATVTELRTHIASLQIVISAMTERQTIILEKLKSVDDTLLRMQASGRTKEEATRDWAIIQRELDTLHTQIKELDFEFRQRHGQRLELNGPINSR